MPTQTLDISWQEGNTPAISKKLTFTAESSIGAVDAPIAFEAVNLEVGPLAIDLAQLKYLFLLAEKNLTLKTNSSGSPDDTVTLSAGIPYVWYEGCGYDIAFSENITAFFVTNNGNASTTLQIRGVQDATP